MSDFKVIETQEELDKIIQKRLAQKDRELAEMYKEYLSPEKASELKAEYEKRLEEVQKTLESANGKLKDHDKVVSDLTERATKAETSLLKGRIAHEAGLPFEIAGRLMGSNEEELKKDAEALSAIIKPTSTAPLRTTEVKGSHAPATTTDAAMYGLLSSLNEQMRSE
jgi:hypothetical protein